MPRVSKGTRVNGHHKPGVPAKFRAGFLSELDGRTELSRALRANYDQIVADLGGMDEVGHVKSAMIERFCWLETILQSIEHGLANGTLDRADALGKWISGVNSLSGLAKILGVDRRISSRPWLAPASLPDAPANEPAANNAEPTTSAVET